MLIGTNSANNLAKPMVGKFCIVYGVSATEMLILTRNIELLQKVAIFKLKKNSLELNPSGMWSFC